MLYPRSHTVYLKISATPTLLSLQAFLKEGTDVTYEMARERAIFICVCDKEIWIRIRLVFTMELNFYTFLTLC